MDNKYQTKWSSGLINNISLRIKIITIIFTIIIILNLFPGYSGPRRPATLTNTLSSRGGKIDWNNRGQWKHCYLKSVEEGLIVLRYDQLLQKRNCHQTPFRADCQQILKRFPSIRKENVSISEPELIFVTDIKDYICGEQICHVEKFQLSILNLNNLWSFIEVKAIFVPNLCGEKSMRRKSMWRKNDKYKV